MKKANLKDALRDLEPFKEEKTLKAVIDEAPKRAALELLPIYERLLIMYKDRRLDAFYKSCLDAIPTADPSKIGPKTIDEFVLHASQHTDYKNYARATGLFVTALIQKSFDAGHNQFDIVLAGPTQIDYLGYTLRGKRDKELTIKIQGTRKCKYEWLVQWFQSGSYLNVTLIGVENVSILSYEMSDCVFRTDNENIFSRSGGGDIVRLINRTQISVIKANKLLDEMLGYGNLELALVVG